MKNRKTVLFLLLTILTLVAIEVLLDMNGKKVRVLSRGFLAENAPASTMVVLTRRGEPKIALCREASIWKLRQPFVSDVERPVVLKLLDTLAQTAVEETISDAELLRLGRTRADYALEEPPLRLCLSNATTCVSMSFGLLTPSGEGVYAAVDGESSVMIVPSSVLTAIDLPVDRFRRRRLFRFEESSVVAFDVKQGSGGLMPFVRDRDGWRVGTNKASSSVVTKFLTDLTSSEALYFIWPTGATNESRQATASLLAGYGLDPESSVTVTVKRSGGMGASLSFGKRANEKSVYAYVHDGGMIVTVPSALKDVALQDMASFSDFRLFAIPAESVSVLSLSDGETMLSASREDKGVWRLDSPVSAPADAVAMESLLRRLLSATSGSRDADGVTVSLGENVTPAVISRAVVFPDGGGVEQLRAKEIVDFSPNEIKRLVSRSSSDGGKDVSIAFSRDRRVWNVESAPEGAVVSEKGVSRVLQALAPLRALRVEKLKVAASDLPIYGLERPSLCLSVDLNRANAVRRNILIGAETEGGAFATVGAADAVFVISSNTVEALSCALTKQLEKAQ